MTSLYALQALSQNPSTQQATVTGGLIGFCIAFTIVGVIGFIHLYRKIYRK